MRIAIISSIFLLFSIQSNAQLDGASAALSVGSSVLKAVPVFGQALGGLTSGLQQAAQIAAALAELAEIKNGVQGTIESIKSMKEMSQSVLKDAKNLDDLSKLEYEELEKYFKSRDQSQAFIDFNEVYLNASRNYRSSRTGNLSLYETVKSATSPQGMRLLSGEYHGALAGEYSSTIKLYNRQVRALLDEANIAEKNALIYRMRAQIALVKQTGAKIGNFGKLVSGDQTYSSWLSNASKEGAVGVEDKDKGHTKMEFSELIQLSNKYLKEAMDKRIEANRMANIVLPPRLEMINNYNKAYENRMHYKAEFKMALSDDYVNERKQLINQINKANQGELSRSAY